MSYAQNKVAAEHAASEIASKGIWLCPCAICERARKYTYAAVKGGLCQRCGKVLFKRSGSKYCCTSCRTSAWARRRKVVPYAAVPTGESIATATVQVTECHIADTGIDQEEVKGNGGDNALSLFPEQKDLGEYAAASNHS